MEKDKRDCGQIVTVTTLTGVCPDCGTELELDYILDSRTLPRCPECGKVIFPCALCGHEDFCQGVVPDDCPYKNTKTVKAKRKGDKL